MIEETDELVNAGINGVKPSTLAGNENRPTASETTYLNVTLEAYREVLVQTQGLLKPEAFLTLPLCEVIKREQRMELKVDLQAAYDEWVRINGTIEHS